MKTEIVTSYEAKRLGLSSSRLFKEGHGAFGESDNSYEDVVSVGGRTVRVSDNDLILYTGESPNRRVLQVLSDWQASDELLSILNPDLLIKRKEKKYQQFLELKKEIESDEFYKPKPTSLTGCPFNYCDSNPKCETKCRHS